MRPDLPNYKKPPVVEVALSVQFEELTDMRTHHIGLLWAKYRERYPLVEEHPLVEPVFEEFPNNEAHGPKIFVRFSESPDFPRCWFLNEDRTRLIQIQNNRFIYNWRKVEGDEEYPRYEDIRTCFTEEFRIFEEFVRLEDLGEIKQNQCDITYVNSIVTDEDIQNHSMIDKVIKPFSFNYGTDSAIFSLANEDAGLNARYVIPNEENKPIGRLHISMQPQYRAKDRKPIFLMKLTARGLPEPCDISGVLSFFNIGREHIVTGFTAWTTDSMHEKWERTR